MRLQPTASVWKGIAPLANPSFLYSLTSATLSGLANLALKVKTAVAGLGVGAIGTKVYSKAQEHAQKTVEHIPGCIGTGALELYKEIRKDSPTKMKSLQDYVNPRKWVETIMEIAPHLEKDELLAHLTGLDSKTSEFSKKARSILKDIIKSDEKLKEVICDLDQFKELCSKKRVSDSQVQSALETISSAIKLPGELYQRGECILLMNEYNAFNDTVAYGGKLLACLAVATIAYTVVSNVISEMVKRA